jgi:hypothetical protein
MNLHGIVNCQASVNGTTRAVDVEVDGQVRVFLFQEQQLGDDHIGDLVCNFAAQKHDAIFEQARINVVCPFTSRCLFNDPRYEHCFSLL